ncbi:MAG: hypothetical protein MJ066_04340 [Clostridia bacterium]|nr:hypothetical protein [Clostridia bacterium]
MTESGFKKKVVAFTVGAVLLFIFLVSYLIYQLVCIKNEKKKEQEYLEAIARYEQMIEEEKDGLEARQLRWWIERRARELGYHYEGDLDLGD